MPVCLGTYKCAWVLKKVIDVIWATQRGFALTNHMRTHVQSNWIDFRISCDKCFARAAGTYIFSRHHWAFNNTSITFPNHIISYPNIVCIAYQLCTKFHLIIEVYCFGKENMNDKRLTCPCTSSNDLSKILTRKDGCQSMVCRFCPDGFASFDKKVALDHGRFNVENYLARDTHST